MSYRIDMYVPSTPAQLPYQWLMGLDVSWLRRAMKGQSYSAKHLVTNNPKKQQEPLSCVIRSIPISLDRPYFLHFWVLALPPSCHFMSWDARIDATWSPRLISSHAVQSHVFKHPKPGPVPPLYLPAISPPVCWVTNTQSPTGQGSVSQELQVRKQSYSPREVEGWPSTLNNLKGTQRP